MRIVHFELPVDEIERAVKFYTEAFGWKIHKWDGPMPYWLVETGPNEEPGINGGFFLRSEHNSALKNTLSVPSVDESTAKITALGGTIVMPKMAVPGVGHMAYCKDTEGNLFGIIEHDKTAQ